MTSEPRVQQLADDLRAEGLHPFALPLGVLRDDEAPASSRCVRCGTCGGFPCRLHAKADAEVIGVRPALRHPGVTLDTGARAVRLLTSPSGREVSAIEVERGGVVELRYADVVVVACGALNSAALLLRSACERHPGGLANGSGTVGRHYMRHVTSSVIGLSREVNATVFQKTLGLNDFYLGGGRETQPLGHVQTLGRCTPGILAAAGADPAPGMTLAETAARALELTVFTEDLPDPRNRVTIAADGRPRVAYAPNNLRAHDRLCELVADLLPRLGCDGRLSSRSVYVGERGGLDNANHQCGTVRFGDDPASSALDVDCKAHELDNLYVADAAVFPSSTAMNPALTVMANAIRVGDHLLERLGASADERTP